MTKTQFIWILLKEFCEALSFLKNCTVFTTYKLLEKIKKKKTNGIFKLKLATLSEIFELPWL